MILLTPQVTGALLGVVAALALSVAAISIRRGSSTDGGSSFDALLVVLLINIVLLTPIALIVYYPDYNLTFRSILAFSAAGLVGTGAGRIFYYKSIELVGASRAEPVKASMPVYATVFAVLFLGEAVSTLRWAGITVIFLGVALISWDLSGGNGLSDLRSVSTIGFFLGVGSAMLFGLEPVFAKIGFAEGTPSMVGLLVKTVAAGSAFYAYAFVGGRVDVDHIRQGDGWYWYVIAGLANTIFLVTYYLGLEIAPVSVVAPLIQISPLFVAGLSYLFLADLERVTAVVVSGALLVVSGATLITVAT
jgi:drug/metabolite transporter (DMT)-like permease